MLYMLSWVINLDRATWDDKLLNGLNFMNKSVLQVPFLLMTFMGYITPTLDEMYVHYCRQARPDRADKTQLYAIYPMGRHDLHSEAQV